MKVTLGIWLGCAAVVAVSSCSTDQDSAMITVDDNQSATTEVKGDGGGNMDTLAPANAKRPLAGAQVAGGGVVKSANYQLVVTVGSVGSQPGMTSGSATLNLGVIGAMEGK